MGIVSTADGNGYWLIGADGGVFAFGDAGGAVEQPAAGHEAQRSRRRRGPALGTWSSPPGTAACSPSAAPPYLGSISQGRLNKPVVGIVSTADGNGYWLIGADGGVFAFGDAAAPSSNPLPGMKLNAPVVGAARAGASGLELTAGDGGVFALGGAPYLGSMAGHSLAEPVSGIAMKPGNAGYWLTARDGDVCLRQRRVLRERGQHILRCASHFRQRNRSVRHRHHERPGRDRLGRWPRPLLLGRRARYQPWSIEGHLRRLHGLHSALPANDTIGVDCSGFARWVYTLAYGHDVLGGGNTNQELSRMNKVSVPAPGDLVFYGRSEHDTHYVGIYIGNGKMIDALRTGTHVEQDNVSIMSDFLGYWQI